MGLKSFKPLTPSRRFLTVSDFAEVTKAKPEKALIAKASKTGGRNNQGRATNINTGGGHKRKYRLIDFKRSKKNIPGKVSAIEYDPFRTSRIALVTYVDGDKRYILAPNGLQVGQPILASETADIKVGNALPMKNIPTGEAVHNIELQPGKGGQIVRSAGTSAQIVAKEGTYVTLKLPSGEMRKVFSECYATIGTVGNADHFNMTLGKAGRARWLGIRPHNRGVTKNPVDDPMGGGEGRSSGGRHPCSPTGLLAKGLKTRHNKRTNKFIVRDRRK